MNPSSPLHHLLIITVLTYLSHTLTRSAYHAFLLSPLCRSSSHPSVPYHYYEPNGPDECSMYLSHERSRQGSHHRFITEKAVFANWARTLNVHFHQPDWKPMAVVSGTNSSRTWFLGGSWDSDGRCGHVRWVINRETLAPLLLTCCVLSLAAWDQHKAHTMFSECNNNRMNIILVQSHGATTSLPLTPCRAALKKLVVTVKLRNRL